jgi:hypothetical protein
MPPLGLPIRGDSTLADDTAAVLTGGVLFVTNRLEAEIRHAEPGELENILANVRVLEIPGAAPNPFMRSFH